MGITTNHTFNLEELSIIEQQKENYLDSLNIKLSDPDLKVSDLALMLKSLEIMDNMEHLSSYKQFIVGIAGKSSDFVAPQSLIQNASMNKTYLSDNLIQNADFNSDSLEIELCKQTNFDTPSDLASPWENGIAYKFDTLLIEGTEIISAITDGVQTAVAAFDISLKPNTQYKLSYNLHVNNVNWELPNRGRNLVDIPSDDTMVFSESGGGPDPVTYICSVIETPALVLPTCDGTVVPWNNDVDYHLALMNMETDCLNGGGTWDEGAINDPNTQQHSIVPYHVEAREGDTIIFINPIGNYLIHNAVSDDNISFTSPDLVPGQQWSWVVDGYHDLYFHCTFHPLEEGRLTTKTNHRYVYNVNHGLNEGDTVKIPVNYGTMIPLPNLSNSYYINIPLPNTSTSIGGAGSQTTVESRYHDLSINDLVDFQSGSVETDPDAVAPVDVIFAGSSVTTASADVTIAAGSVSSITLLDGGSGYQEIPEISIEGGGGYGALADVSWSAIVNSITLLDGGSGYQTVPDITFTGGNASETATATAVLSTQSVAALVIDDGGVGYTSVPDVTITGGGATVSATAEANIDFDTGTLISISIMSAGDQYTSNPVVTISGGGASAQALVSAVVGSSIESIILNTQGVDYISVPEITIDGGNPVTTATASGSLYGSVTDLTLTEGGIAYGSSTGGVAVGERQWETYVIAGVSKGSERIDIYFNDENQIGHVHEVTITPAQYATIQTGTPTQIITGDDDTGHTHVVTFDWNPGANEGAGAIIVVGMAGGHTHGLDEYFVLSGGTKVELVNFGHYHEILINETDEAILAAGELSGLTQDTDGTWSHDGNGTTLIRTSDFGTSDPQHFHTVEFGCIDAINDIYIIIEIDQHIHDFGRVWYPGSNMFNIGIYDNSYDGGDDLNPVTIGYPFTDIPGFVKKQRGINCADHGMYPGDRIHFTNVYNGIHHGNTNYWIESVVDKDNFVLTESVVYPLAGAPGTTPSFNELIESYTVVADLASYRFQVERDITNHIGSPYVEGVQIQWSRPNVVESINHGLSIGDVVQLPSGIQQYIPSELPGTMVDHTVVGLGDGYGPTEHMEIVVDTNATITYADPDLTIVEGAQDTPWLWSWWDHTDVTYYPYQRPGAEKDSFGGNDGTNGGFVLHRGGTYKFTNNAWNASGHIIRKNPISGEYDIPMYMHAAGIKAIPGGGWDNLIQEGMSHVAGLDPVTGEHRHCVSLRANHGIDISVGDHNQFIDSEENPGNWIGTETFPVCMSLNGWCEEIDVDGWYYNGVDSKTECTDLNPAEDVGLAQWKEPEWIGNFSKEFTWTVPENFGLSGSDGATGLGPFNAPGETNLAYHIEPLGTFYKFDKSGMIEGTNRTINLYRGGTYRFKINAAGHPIYVTTDNGSHFTPGSYFGEYTLGVVGSRSEEGAGDQSGNKFGTDDNGIDNFELMTFTVPEAAPDTLYYQCAWHGGMIGTFNIIDLPVTNAGEDVIVYYHHGQDNMYTPLHIQDKVAVDNGSSDDYFQVQPTPGYSFPVPGTQDHKTSSGNLLSAEGLGIIPKAQAKNIELGNEQFIDAIDMVIGDDKSQFVITNDFSGDAKFYVSVNQGERSDFSVSNFTISESPWIELGSMNIDNGSAYTTDAATGGTLEQLVTGSINDGEEYEIGYDIIETIRDSSDIAVGTLQVKLIGDTTVEGLIHTDYGSYTQTLIAPINTVKMSFEMIGKGKIDNISLKERVIGQNAWYMSEGWNADEGTANSLGHIQSQSEISQSVPIESGKLYEVSYNLTGTDPEGDGPQGRLQLSLGTNPNNLIKNWNFDASDVNAINWSTSNNSIVLNTDNSTMNFTDAVNSTIEYTFADNLSNIVNYEIIIDIAKITGTNHLFNIHGTSQHVHSIELSQAEYDYLKSDTDATISTQQIDDTHAQYYTHTFTINYSAELEIATFILSGGDDAHNHEYSCDYDDYTNLMNGTYSELNVTHLTQLDQTHPHEIVISKNNEGFVVVSDDNETHVHIAFAADELDSGFRIVTQTFWEGHDVLDETGTTTTISDVNVKIGTDDDYSESGIINEIGIHNITINGAIGTKLNIVTNGTGVINSIKMKEIQVPVLDHHTSGMVNEGEKKYFIRAGDYDSKLHLVGDVDKRPIETHAPYYYSRGFKGSIDNVSVKLVEELWTFDSQIGGKSEMDVETGRLYTSGAGGSARGIAHVSFSVVEDQHYKVFFNVKQPTGSVVKIGTTPDSSSYAEYLIAAEPAANIYDETRDFVFKAKATGICYLTLSTIEAGFTYWDDVQVKTIPNLSSDEYLLLGRALNVFGMPLGGEERWKQHNLDKENEDYTGQVLTGFRTMESYGENIVEEYYDIAKRQDELLDNLEVTWMSNDRGYVGDTITLEGRGFKSNMTVVIGGVSQVVTDVHIPSLISFVVASGTPTNHSDVVITALGDEQFTMTDAFLKLT